MTHSEVKAALRTFADGDASDADYRTTIDDAVAALSNVRTAADFVAADGHRRLRTAVAAASRANDGDAAERGQTALQTLTHYRRAAAANHFHSGRGTVLSRGGQSFDE